MRKAFDKFKARFEDVTSRSPSRRSTTSPPVGTGHLPHGFHVEQDLYRYRKQRGVNLGSWFVLERWISEAPFQSACDPAQSDLDVAKGDNAKEILEQHWDTWITEEDWAWLAEKGINTVRIPIGYYHLCGADAMLVHGTDFEDVKIVYLGAWSRVRSALATAYRYGIGVLFDLHAAPGKQNHDSHGGTSLKPAFFDDPKHMTQATRVLTTLVSHLLTFARTHDPPLPNLVGLELLNEPAPGTHAEALKAWYLDASRAIRALDPGLPLYIADCWQPEQYAQFVKHAETPFLVLDHHLYRCFTGEDISTPAGEHARRLRDAGDGGGTPAAFARARGELEGAGGALVVGEWSAALNPGSFAGVEDGQAAKREFVEAQLALFAEQCAGWFFWTYKKEQPGDTGWSFREAYESGVFPPDLGRMRFNAGKASGAGGERKERARDEALDAHSGYWSQYPGHYEHQRFYDGFSTGWDDALMFASAGQELGFRGPWVKRRASEHVARRGDGNVWEFEHGFLQGVQAAMKDMSV